MSSSSRGKLFSKRMEEKNKTTGRAEKKINFRFRKWQAVLLKSDNQKSLTWHPLWEMHSSFRNISL